MLRERTAFEPVHATSEAGILPQKLQAYLKTLSAATALLLEENSEEIIPSVLRLIGETSGAGMCMVYLNADAALEKARLNACWCLRSTRADPADQLIHYDEIPELAETLQAGMVYHKPDTDLPPDEFVFFGRRHATVVLSIPFFIDGEYAGFLQLIRQSGRELWNIFEVSLLCALANGLAMALTQQATRRKLNTSVTRLQGLAGASEDITVEFDHDGCILNLWSVNPLLAEQLHHNGMQSTLHQALPADMANAILHAMPAAVPPPADFREDFEFTLPLRGETHYFLGRLQFIPQLHSEELSALARIRDVTEIMQAEARRVATLQTLDLLEEAIVDLSPEGMLLHASAAFATLLHSSRSEVEAMIGSSLLQHVPPEDHAMLSETLRDIMSGDSSAHSLRFRLEQKSGDTIWVEGKFIIEHALNGEIRALRGILRDITTSYLQEKRITQMALHDALTGLPNRVLLEDHLQQAIFRADRDFGKVALGFIDLDHFKHINDTLGHSAGDTVLLTVSQRLRSVLRDVDTLSRWGGDEFVVLLTDATDEAGIRDIADRLRDAARERIQVDGIDAKLTISIGFAVYPDDATNAEALMSAADHTMFHAKNIGRNNVQFYSDIQTRAIGRADMELQTQLIQAVQDGNIDVFFQPIFDISTNRIVSFEALARWHHPETGWINPAVFIPMTEHLGLIHELGDIVFIKTLYELRQWKRAGFNVTASVNLSRAQFFAPDFLQHLLDSLEAYELTPHDVILEITESVALLDMSYESKRLNELAQAGFTLAIDDFGTGYSALAQLHQMPVNEIKIDASFTSRLAREDGRRIVQAIVQMAQALNLSIVVEGVEMPECVEFLQTLGVTHMQGFLFSHALNPEHAFSLLRQGLPTVIPSCPSTAKND